jgi:nematocidal protein AidA
MAKVSTPIKHNAASSHITINVMTVIGVDAIIAANPNLSKDATKPTPIGHANIWMVSDDPRGWSTNGDPANISLKANVGDTLSFYTASMVDNSDSAAFIYQLNGGAPVLNPSVVNIITLQGAAQPTAPNGYPFQPAKESFSSCDAKVSRQGTAQNFWACAALFTTDNSGENQILAGYVTWDPTVVVE